MRNVRLLWLAVLCAAQAGDFPRELHAYLGTTPVLDGRIAPGEWADATRFHGPKGWISQFSPVQSPEDLSFTGYVKHDGKSLHFAFEVIDDVLYGIDTPRWLPDNHPEAHALTREGWPWFGDEIELLIHAGPKWKGDEGAAGNGFSWQMVANLTKSRLGGVGEGGLLEGEPRSDEKAWETYRKWILNGSMRAAAKPRPGGGAYTIEWSVSFDPCLEVEAGRFYSPALGNRSFGLNIAVGDLDQKEAGTGNFGNFHHEDWFAGGKDVRTHLRQWGTLWIHPSPPPRHGRP